MFSAEEFTSIMVNLGKVFDQPDFEGLKPLNQSSRYSPQPKKPLKKTLEILRAYFPDMVITGSAALFLYELQTEEEVKDIDILIPNTLENLSKVKALHTISSEQATVTQMSPKEETPKPWMEEENEINVPKVAKDWKIEIPKSATPINFQYLFRLDGWAVDVFSTQEQSFFIIEDFKLSPLIKIVQAKKRYGRVKDHLQLRTLSRLFFNEEDWLKYINNPKSIKYVNSYE